MIALRGRSQGTVEEIWSLVENDPDMFSCVRLRPILEDVMYLSHRGDAPSENLPLGRTADLNI
jgi:hypothetical protein